MSTYIYLLCEDCNKPEQEEGRRLDLEAKNYWSDEAWQLIDALPQAVVFLEKVQIESIGFLINLTFECWSGHGPMVSINEWVIQHGRHKVCVYDEGGHVVPRSRDGPRQGGYLSGML